MTAVNERSIPWQHMLDIFTSEIKEPRHTEFWTKLQSLNKVEELVSAVYTFSLFRKRLNAWLAKNPRVYKTNSHKCTNIPEFPAGNIKEHVTLKRGENSSLPSASNVVQLKENKEKGRYVVASETIYPGDTLFLETPFTLVLCDTESTHCDFCCLPLPIEPARCPQCENVNYCSSACLAEANKQFHTHECGSCLMQHVGIARLALRVTLVAESLDCLTSSANENEPLVLQYSQVMHLLTHLEEMNPEDKFHYTLTSVMLTMDQIRMRDLHGTEVRRAFMCNFGGRTLYHLAQMVCNGNAITAYIMNSSREDNSLVQEQQVRIATAIYPSASMMNHSCDPNILTSYVGHTLIARAARTINTGEEVLNCYGPHFTTTATKERKEQLKQQYFFVCHCRPCSLPKDFLLTEGIEALLCPQCKGPVTEDDKVCLHCQHRLTVEELTKLRNKQKVCADVLYEGDQMIVGGDLIEAEKCVFHGLQLQKQFLHPNNRKLALTHDILGMILAKQGKYESSFEHLKSSLSIQEKCYGAMSVEVSGTIDTMLDVAAEDLASLQGKNWQEKLNYAMELCKRGMEIVNILLGPWHPRMQSFLTSEKQLQLLQENFQTKYKACN